MDKKIDEELLDRPVDIRLKLNRQTAPDGETYYRANVQHRPTLDEQDLAGRFADKRSEMRPETLLYAYRCLKEEIYEALLNGHSVDLGFGLLTLRVQGRFEHPADRFDPARHAFNVAFTPAPRLLQLEKSLTAQPPSTQTADRRPVILEANYRNPSFTSALIRDAAMHGCTYIPGKRWLLYQALTGFRIFTGETPDIGKMSEVL